METIRGKLSLEMTASDLQQKINDYEKIQLDLGTGDGRFVRCMSEKHADQYFIGVDACRENLHVNSRLKLSNALFVIASAQALPEEFDGLFSQINVNFPWGSLLVSLLTNDTALITRLQTITHSCAGIDVLLNAEACKNAGFELEAGAQQMIRILRRAGWKIKLCLWLDAKDLRVFPSTWARRLAIGRDPRAVRLSFQNE